MNFGCFTGTRTPDVLPKKKKAKFDAKSDRGSVILKENGIKREFYGPHARQEVASTIGCHQLAH